MTTPQDGNINVTSMLSALAGGALWALANGFAVVFAPDPPDKRAKQRALYEAVASMFAATVGGAIVAPAIDYWFRITQIELVSLFGLLTGLIFWKITPMLTKNLIKISLNKVDALGGVKDD